MNNKYKKNYLDRVIIRLDFSSEVSLSRVGLNKKTSDSILKLFPIFEPKKHTHKNIDITLTPVKETTKEESHLLFQGNERERTLVIAPDYLSLEYSRYSNFEDMKRELMHTVEALLKQEDFSLKRIGLRYINKIQLNEKDPLNWKKYFIPSLINNLKIVPRQENLTRIFSNIIQTFEDEMTLNFRYGIFNSDYPSRIKKKEFILDFDAYKHDLIQSHSIVSEIETYHQRINELFESVIKDEFRNKLGVITKDEL